LPPEGGAFKNSTCCLPLADIFSSTKDYVFSAYHKRYITLRMKFYRINSEDNCWGLVNLHRVIVGDLYEGAEAIVFDDILRIKVDKQDYQALRKDILKKMFKRL